MPDLGILKELIRNEAQVFIECNAYGKQQVTLTEPDSKNHAGYSVIINNIPKESMVIKTDAFPAPCHFFNGTKGECKRADFVIIANKNTKNFIVFIELKKTKGEIKEIIQQLKGSECLIDYFRSIVAVFWRQKHFLKIEKYEYRFVSIHHIGINKKTTFCSHSDGIHDQAEQMLKIGNPHHKLQFNEFIRKHQ